MDEKEKKTCKVCGREITTEFEQIDDMCLACMSAQVKDQISEMAKLTQGFKEQLDQNKTPSGIHISNLNDGKSDAEKIQENSNYVIALTEIMLRSLMFVSYLGSSQVLIHEIIKHNDLKIDNIDEFMRPIIERATAYKKEMLADAATAKSEDKPSSE